MRCERVSGGAASLREVQVRYLCRHELDPLGCAEVRLIFLDPARRSAILGATRDRWPELQKFIKSLSGEEALVLSKAIVSNSSLAFNFMLENPDRYWPLFMTVTQSQRDELEAEGDRLAGSLQDAKDPQFVSVFPPDILAQGQHLVFLMIAREAVRDPSTSYRRRFIGKSRRIVFALAADLLLSLDSQLENFMSGREQEEYRRLKRTPYASMILEPRPNSFGLCAILGIHPE